MGSAGSSGPGSHAPDAAPGDSTSERFGGATPKDTADGTETKDSAGPAFLLEAATTKAEDLADHHSLVSGALPFGPACLPQPAKAEAEDAADHHHLPGPAFGPEHAAAEAEDSAHPRLHLGTCDIGHVAGHGAHGKVVVTRGVVQTSGFPNNIDASSFVPDRSSHYHHPIVPPPPPPMLSPRLGFLPDPAEAEAKDSAHDSPVSPKALPPGLSADPPGRHPQDADADSHHLMQEAPWVPSTRPCPPLQQRAALESQGGQQANQIPRSLLLDYQFSVPAVENFNQQVNKPLAVSPALGVGQQAGKSPAAVRGLVVEEVSQQAGSSSPAAAFGFFAYLSQPAEKSPHVPRVRVVRDVDQQACTSLAASHLRVVGGYSHSQQADKVPTASCVRVVKHFSGPADEGLPSTLALPGEGLAEWQRSAANRQAERSIKHLLWPGARETQAPGEGASEAVLRMTGQPVFNCPGVVEDGGFAAVAGSSLAGGAVQAKQMKWILKSGSAGTTPAREGVGVFPRPYAAARSGENGGPILPRAPPLGLALLPDPAEAEAEDSTDHRHLLPRALSPGLSADPPGRGPQDADADSDHLQQEAPWVPSSRLSPPTQQSAAPSPTQSGELENQGGQRAPRAPAVEYFNQQFKKPLAASPAFGVIRQAENSSAAVRRRVVEDVNLQFEDSADHRPLLPRALPPGRGPQDADADSDHLQQEAPWVPSTRFSPPKQQSAAPNPAQGGKLENQGGQQAPRAPAVEYFNQQVKTILATSPAFGVSRQAENSPAAMRRRVVEDVSKQAGSVSPTAIFGLVADLSQPADTNPHIPRFRVVRDVDPQACTSLAASHVRVVGGYSHSQQADKVPTASRVRVIKDFSGPADEGLPSTLALPGEGLAEWQRNAANRQAELSIKHLLWPGARETQATGEGASEVGLRMTGQPVFNCPGVVNDGGFAAVAGSSLADEAVQAKQMKWRLKSEGADTTSAREGVGEFPRPYAAAWIGESGDETRRGRSKAVQKNECEHGRAKRELRTHRVTTLEVVDMLDGLWQGSEGDTYEILFLKHDSWICERLGPKGTKRFPVRWDIVNSCVVWGESYFLDPSELEARKSQAVWHPLQASRKKTFVWHKARTSGGA